MASVLGDENLEFFIRTFPGGEVSGYLAERARIGDAVFLKGPFGESFLRKEETGPILTVGGSTGIAPILSILKESIPSGLKQKIYVYFGVRSKAEFFALEALIGLQAANSNIAVRLVTVEDPKSDRFRHGQVGDIVLGEWKEFSGNWTAFIAGSPPMVDSLVPALIERGIMQIYTDPFMFGASKETIGKRSEAK